MVWAWLSVPVPWRGAGSAGVEHPCSNHVGNVLLSAWLDLFNLFSPTAVTQRQQQKQENSQTVSCFLLPFWGAPLWLKDHRDFVSARACSLTSLPGHICRDHIKRLALHVPLPHLPGLPITKSLWVKVAAISHNS